VIEVNVQFIEPSSALVDARRLAGGPMKHAREQDRTATVTLPVYSTSVFSKIRRRRERRAFRVCRRRPRHGLPAAGVPVLAAIDQKAVGAEAGLAASFIEAEGDIDRLAPVLRRLDVEPRSQPGSLPMITSTRGS